MVGAKRPRAEAIGEFVAAWAESKLAFRVVESKRLQKLFREKPPDRATLSKATEAAADQLRIQIVKDLKQCAKPVTVCFDLGTVNRIHYCTSTLCCDGSVYFWRCDVMPDDSSWGEIVFDFISTITDRLQAAEVPVVAFCCDNASAMLKAARMLTEKYPGTVTVPCAVHSLQLVLRTLESNPLVKSCIELVKQLREVNKSVPQVVSTRWTSELRAMKAALAPDVCSELLARGHITVGQVAELKQVADTLAPFDVATQLLQSDYATAFHLITTVVGLMKWAKSPAAAIFGDTASKTVEQRWIQNWSSPAVLLCFALLPFDMLKMDDNRNVRAGICPQKLRASNLAPYSARWKLDPAVALAECGVQRTNSSEPN